MKAEMTKNEQKGKALNPQYPKVNKVAATLTQKGERPDFNSWISYIYSQNAK